MTSYEIIKFIHVSTVIISILGFILRVSLKLLSTSYAQRFWFKKFPHVIDSLLLASALGMVFLLNINPFTTSWLAEKIIGLLGYILLGMIALHWSHTITVRLLAAGGAIVVFAYIVFVALSKKPLILFGP